MASMVGYWVHRSYINFSSVCLFVCLMSVCNVFVTMVTLLISYISAENKDNDTKFSGYDPWGLLSTSIAPKPNPTSPTLNCHDLS